MLKIRELRVEKGMLLSELAEKLNKSAVCLGDWERGRCEPSIEDLIKLSAIFGCTVDYLLGVDSDYVSVTSRETDLTYDEFKLVKMYRVLSERDKNFISDVFNRLITPEERAKLNLL